PVKLIAVNSNTLAKPTNYIFELDTTEYFNSAFKQSQVLHQTGGILEWTPGISLESDRVYYWRVAPDSSGSGRFAWRTSSFVYLPGHGTGWNQSHFFQHRKNEFQKMQLNEPNRNFQFADAFVEIRANNGYIELPSFIRPRIYVGTDVAADYDYWNYASDFSGVVINVFDPLTGNLWVNASGRDYNSYFHPGYLNKPFFVFKTETADERRVVMDFLENSIPPDHVVVFNTMTQFQHSYFPDRWESDGSRNLFSVLEAFGAREVRSLRSFNSVPYVLIFRKDRPEFEVRESIGNFTDETEVSHSFTIKQTSGKVHSVWIGPAKSWSQFEWGYKNFNPSEESQEIHIYGVKSNNEEDRLFGPLIANLQDLNSIDAELYPRLRLEWNSTDSISRTAPELEFWRVYNTGLPDAAFAPARKLRIMKDSLDQGDPFEVDIEIGNIGMSGMDSLLVKFTLVDPANQEISSYSRFAPMEVHDFQTISYQIGTSKRSGAHKLFIELNPDQDQAELHTFNNTTVIPFYIRRDKRQPYMDVTFDQRHIANQDYVSPKVRIEISLQDENRDLILNDSSIFTIKLKEPGGSLQRLYFSEGRVEFIPATPSDRTAKALIRGDFQKEGLYTLAVNAIDGSGNAAAEQDYQIDFRVAEITADNQLLNYPNPFSRSTRFVYKLTAEEIPDHYVLQILSLSGKVVREISKAELGPLYIGTNITDYSYDGLDQLGNPLPNGVYPYRFVVKDPGGSKSWEGYEDRADRFFENNFGKMVILR
ncbi:MAG TPA: hypothetical protein VFX48_06140, partial [Saprospiraceae bacterium]|nr:hypothetical protein [Saprospiraceae bacterium]